jgi:hypothetical protein
MTRMTPQGRTGEPVSASANVYASWMKRRTTAGDRHFRHRNAVDRPDRKK